VSGYTLEQEWAIERQIGERCERAHDELVSFGEWARRPENERLIATLRDACSPDLQRVVTALWKSEA
jgi:hypothetical protein